MKAVKDSSSAIPFAFGASAGRVGPTALEEQVVALFDQLRVPVLRYLISNRVPVADAEEIVQEVFLLLFQRLREGRLEGSASGWVFGAAHNYAMRNRENARRDAGRVNSGELNFESLPDPAAGAEEVLRESERQQSLLAVVRALPEQQQQCLHLRAEGVRYRDIARILGMSLGAVASALRQALEKLSRADTRT
jgi:RNA polymerase sigma-70 factor (ECF subfamily)